MAETSQGGGILGQLPTFLGNSSSGEGGVRNSRVRRQATGNGWTDPAAIRQLLAPGPGRNTIGCNENQADALPG